MDLRHEWKHRINVEDLILLRQRLPLLAKPDPYAVGGCYHIRSLYFDTPSDKALREKLDGVNGREKFRIRCYNRDFSLIHLEKKSKRNGLGRKEKVRLTPDQVQALMNGETNWMMASGNPLLQELCCKMKLQGLRPRTLVDYIREPFVYGPGNVRVTLDHQLRTGLRCVDFLNVKKRFTQLKCFVAIPHILLNSFNQIQRKGNPLYESIKARFGTELGEDMFYIPAINFPQWFISANSEIKPLNEWRKEWQIRKCNDGKMTYFVPPRDPNKKTYRKIKAEVLHDDVEYGLLKQNILIG